MHIHQVVPHRGLAAGVAPLVGMQVVGFEQVLG